MLFYKQISDSKLLGIWRFEESKEELSSALENNIIDDYDVSLNKRIIERLTIRVLLKELLGRETPILYEASGKPYLQDKSYYISISHTKDYAAIILDKENETGIDIEQISEKVMRVRNRFISDTEWIDPENELIHLLLHWSAKETMYKAIGENETDLKAHLHIQNFVPKKKGSFFAYETKTIDKQKFTINYQITNKFVLTWI